MTHQHRAVPAPSGRPFPYGPAVLAAGGLLLLMILGSVVWKGIGSVVGGTPVATASGRPFELAEASFDREVLRVDEPVLVDFWAPWCGPCRQMGKTLEQVGPEYAGRLRILKLNVDDHPGLAHEYNVRAIPTLIVFRDGKEVTRIRGAVPAPQLRQRLDGAIG